MPGSRFGQCDLALLAGDITDSNSLDGYGEVIGAIKEMSDADIVAVFGNEEYDASHLDYRQRFRITFLEDEVKDFVVEGVKLRIVGSTGSLDRPTWWQRNNVPDIWRRYKERVNKVGGLLERGDADVLDPPHPLCHDVCHLGGGEGARLRGDGVEPVRAGGAGEASGPGDPRPCPQRQEACAPVQEAAQPGELQVDPRRRCRCTTYRYLQIMDRRSSR